MSDRSRQPGSALIAAPLLPLPTGLASAGARRASCAPPARLDADPDDYWDWVAAAAPLARALAHRALRRARATSATSRAGGSTSPTTASTAGPRTRRRPTAPPIVWEGEPGDTRTVTYAELADEVYAAGRAAWSPSASVRATSSAIYMPNLVEAFTAIHACNRIGAIYTVLFSGFGRGRRGLAAAGGPGEGRRRRRRDLPARQAGALLETLRAARGRTPRRCEHVVVVDRTGDGVPLDG